MTTLTRHHEPAPADVDAVAPALVPAEDATVAPPAAPGLAGPPAPGDAALPAEAQDAAAPRLCTACAAPMAAGQDWCLECGTAAPGRLGRRPGWRAVMTTLVLTVVLVASAGAASYAALNADDTAGQAGGAVATGPAVAQVPPIVAPPAPIVPPVVVPPATSTPPAPPPKVTIPKQSTPAPPAPTPAPAPVTPAAAPSAATPAPQPQAPAKTTTTSTPRSTDTAAGPRGKGTTADGGTGPVAADLTPLTLGAASVALYDPYKRALGRGDAAAAHDGDAATAFSFAAPDDGKDLQVGLVVDLGSAKQVRGLQLTTSTPGAGVEVYGADGSALPPDILDTRWDHPASRAGVKATERIAFPKGGARYRYLTVWFTQPPTGGPKVAIKELQVLH